MFDLESQKISFCDIYEILRWKGRLLMVLLVFRELVEWMVLFQASKASFGSPYSPRFSPYLLSAWFRPVWCNHVLVCLVT